MDAAARKVIADAGPRREFVHGLGHGVGLQIHEAPLLAPGHRPRWPWTWPSPWSPGVYLTGRGGVRIEDTRVVRDGEPELLTRFPKDLLEI